MEDHKINVKVDTGTSVKDLEKLESALNDVSEEIVPLTSIMGDMEDKLMLMAHAGDTTSDEFKRLSHEVAGMRKTIRETDAGIEALSMTASQKLGGAISGIASGFELAQGAMGAFGANSEAVEQALLKVQSAMAIAQGIQGIKEAIPSFKALKADILGSAAAQGQLTTAQKIYNLVVGKSTGAMKALKLAIATSGVGALVLILGEAISALSSFGDNSNEAEKKQKALEKQIRETNNELNKTTKEYERYIQGIDNTTQRLINQAKRRGESEEDIQKIERQGRKDRITAMKGEEEIARWRVDLFRSQGRSIQEIEAADKAYYAAHKKRVAEQLSYDTYATEEFVKLREAADERAKASAQANADKRKEAISQIREAEQEYKDSLLTDQELEIQNANKKWGELLDQAKKYGQDTKIIREAWRNEVNNIDVKYEQERRAAQDEADKAEYEKQVAENEKRIALEDQQFALEKELEYKRIEEKDGIEAANKAKERDALIASYEEKFAVAGENHELEKQLTEQQKKELDDIDAKYAEDQKKRQKELNAARLDAAKQGFDLLGNLAQAFAGKSKKQQKKAFQIQKAAGIASATIDTYKAAQTAFASAPNPILGAIFAALAVAAGLLNIKKIASQKFDEGGGEGGGGVGGIASGGGGGGGAPSTPEFNIVGNSPVSQLAQISTQPQQAYVVSGEVTSAQSLDRNRVTNATL
jgi:DNA repair exonuclease SbcCD ATPase subunit